MPAGRSRLDRQQKRHLKISALRGVEIVDGVTRLCAMNLLLHGIGPEADEAEPPVTTDDSLRADPGDRFDVVLINPPFGKRSSYLYVNEEGEQDCQVVSVVRDDFYATTSSEQLNFLQHVKTLLKVPGRAAVVVPDNVLLEGGAGETIRRSFLKECDVHTLLRFPTGIFDTQGVKANVLFFDRKPASATPPGLGDDLAVNRPAAGGHHRRVKGRAESAWARPGWPPGSRAWASHSGRRSAGPHPRRSRRSH